MVIDWNKQIDECIKNTKIMPIFHGNIVSYGLQNALIVKRLESKGYDDRQILNWMILAGSDKVHDLDDVHLIQNQAKNKRWPKKHDFKIFVTMDEIKYIDNLKTTKENKSYLLGLICFAKMMKIKRKKPVLKRTYRSYIYYMVTGADDYWNGKQRYRVIDPFINKLCTKKVISFDPKKTKFTVYTANGPIKEEINDTLLKAKWVDWNASDGYAITTLETDVKMLADHAFQDQIGICPKCGSQFIITPYTKTCLCHDCQKAVERERVNKWKLAHPGLKHSKPGVKHDKHKTHSHGKRDLKKKEQNGGGKYQMQP